MLCAKFLPTYSFFFLSSCRLLLCLIIGPSPFSFAAAHQRRLFSIHLSKLEGLFFWVYPMAEGWLWPPQAESWPPYWPPWPDPNHSCNHHITAVTTFQHEEPFLHCNGTTGHFRSTHIVCFGYLARRHDQSETGCAGSLQSLKKWRVRHRLPASAAPTVFPQRITLQPLSEVAGEVLPAVGGGDLEASGEGQWVVGGCCLPESIQRTFLRLNTVTAEPKSSPR